MGALLSLLGWRTTFVINAHRVAVVRRLGEGGFAVVDLVRDVDTGLEFALKRVLCAVRCKSNRYLKKKTTTDPPTG
jgi:hypothetical protein